MIGQFHLIIFFFLFALSSCGPSEKGDLKFTEFPGSNSGQLPSTDSEQIKELQEQLLQLRARQKEKEQDWQELVHFAQETFIKVQPLLKSKCYACHDQETPLPFYGKPFPSKNSVKKHREDGIKALDFSVQFPLKSLGNTPQSILLKAIKTSLLDKTMPLKRYIIFLPWKRVSKKDRAEIFEWIDPLLIELEEFEAKYARDDDNSLESQVRRIFQNKCFQCHANGNARGGYGNMQDLTALVQSSLINREMPSDSKLMKLMDRSMEPAMPPSLRQAMSSDELALIQEWIENSLDSL